MSRLSDAFPEPVQAFFSERPDDFALPVDGLLPLEQVRQIRSWLPEGSSLIIHTIRQVHGERVLAVGTRPPDPLAPLPEADALITDQPGVALTIRTADCLPVYLYDARKGCLGLAHAGWRGSAAGIAAATVREMTRRYGSQAADLRVVLGPSIRACCYEVAGDFQDRFPGQVQVRGGRLYLDLPAVNIAQLRQCGVPAGHIHVLSACTCCEERFFSYRRQGAAAGRHLSLVMRP